MKGDSPKVEARVSSSIKAWYCSTNSAKLAGGLALKYFDEKSSLSFCSLIQVHLLSRTKMLRAKLFRIGETMLWTESWDLRSLTMNLLKSLSAKFIRSSSEREVPCNIRWAYVLGVYDWSNGGKHNRLISAWSHTGLIDYLRVLSEVVQIDEHVVTSVTHGVVLGWVEERLIVTEAHSTEIIIESEDWFGCSGDHKQISNYYYYI